ncbi:halotolerance protein [Pseudozyma hubeiensis SY62]|uniref:Halotolerance protein n=1 Tax=Pseudozyma hubeiensis (strain SY62) TaxID=1305764 RepID=R9NZ49_PSEHS|nr:halotolerance protein [Pseudozyma hubeiensis SY62]GAC94123.1 halotolerance protein [Pseudozyma hubeiensis SY62]
MAKWSEKEKKRATAKTSHLRRAAAAAAAAAAAPDKQRPKAERQGQTTKRLTATFCLIAFAALQQPIDALTPVSPIEIVPDFCLEILRSLHLCSASLQVRSLLARRRRHPLNACSDLSSPSSISHPPSTFSFLLSSTGIANARRRTLSFVHRHLTQVVCLGTSLSINRAPFDSARPGPPLLANNTLRQSRRQSTISSASKHPFTHPSISATIYLFEQLHTIRQRLQQHHLPPPKRCSFQSHFASTKRLYRHRISTIARSQPSSSRLTRLNRPIASESGHSVSPAAVCSGSAYEPFTRCITFLLQSTYHPSFWIFVQAGQRRSATVYPSVRASCQCTPDSNSCIAHKRILQIQSVDLPSALHDRH